MEVATEAIQQKMEYCLSWIKYWEGWGVPFAPTIHTYHHRQGEIAIAMVVLVLVFCCLMTRCAVHDGPQASVQQHWGRTGEMDKIFTIRLSVVKPHCIGR
jgi:hypothetical protein